MTDPIAELNKRGRDNFASLVEGGEKRLDALFRTVPALGEVAVGTVYGHLHHRTALDPRTREAVTLAAIVAAGMTGPPLSVHVRTGLASGLSPAEITEVVVQTAAFAGFPRAVTAANELNRIFDELGLASPPATAPREVVLTAFAAAKDDQSQPEGIAKLFAQTREIAVTAVSANQVIVELRGEDEPLGLVLVTVDGERITDLRPFLPA